MPLLLSLKSAWEHRNEIVLGLLIISLFVIYSCVAKINALKSAVAEEHSRVDSSVSLHETHAPVKVTRRFVPAPAGSKCEPVLAEEVEERGEVVVDRDEHKLVVTDKVPVLADSPRRIVGLGLDIMDPKHVREIHAGYSLFGRVDAVYSFSLEGPAAQRHGLLLSYRF